MEHAAGNFQKGEPLALAVPADLEHPGGKFRRVGGPGSVLLQAPKELLHPLELQRRAEPAGEDLPPGDQPAKGVPAQPPGVQILPQGRFAAGGRLLPEALLPGGEVHAAPVQLLPELGEEGGPVNPRGVHLIDKQKHRDPPLPEKPPQGQGVGLDPGGGADHQHRAVQHLQRALHLPGEIHMARGIQDGHLRRGQGQQGLLGENGDTPAALLLIGVQEGVPVIHPPQLPQLAGGV